MNIHWTLDRDRRLIRVVVRDGVSEADYVAAIRSIGAATNQPDAFAILADLRALSDMPDFLAIMRMTRLIEELQFPRQHHLALLATPQGAVYGKARQIVTILTTLDISAELFLTPSDAMTWLQEKQPSMLA